MAGTDSPDAYDPRCVFCRMVRGEAPTAVVFEDDVSLAFLDHRPLLPGHCLLIPKSHVATLADLPPALVAPLFANAQLLARAVETGLGAEGSFLAINNRVSQSVPHLHVHVVPRRNGDGLFAKSYVWKRRPYPDEETIRQTQEAIWAAVASQRSCET